MSFDIVKLAETYLVPSGSRGGVGKEKMTGMECLVSLLERNRLFLKHCGEEQ